MPEVVEPRPRRRTLFAEWICDLMMCFVIALPFEVPIFIEINVNRHHFEERFEVSQFASSRMDAGQLRKWDAEQKNIQAVRVYPLAKDQLVLRYVANKTRDGTTPDWNRLGYAKPRLLSRNSVEVTDRNLPRSALGWGFQLAATTIGFVVLFPRVKRAWAPRLPWGAPSFKSWLLVIAVLLVSMVIYGGGRWLSGQDPVISTDVQAVFPELSGLAKLLAWCSVCVVGPLFEETLFRGCLFGRFRSHGYAVSGAVLAAALFSASHGVWLLLPVYFLNALVLAWVCHRTASLWTPVAVHAGWNIFALQLCDTLVTINRRVFVDRQGGHDGTGAKNPAPALETLAVR